MFLEILLAVILLLPFSLYAYSWYISDIPKYYTKAGTKLHKKVKQNVKLLNEKYHPSWWCPFGTTQTVVRQVFRNCPVLPFEREIVEFEDGGAAGIDWLIPTGTDDTTPIVIFLPGITGSTHDSSYVLHPVQQANEMGWKCLVVNPRGLGGVTLRTSKTYNAARPTDFEHIAKMVDERFPDAKKVACGFSMGGMILWNYLAMVGDDARLDAGMIISSPWDPMVASDSIECFIPQTIFNSFIAKCLVEVVKPYRELFKDKVDFEKVLKSTTVRGFDQSFVAPIFGYNSYEDYYKEATLKTKVDKIKIPVVTLNSVDDYFSPVQCIPIDDMLQSENVVGIITGHGGHTAFMASSDPNAPGLVEKLLAQWGHMIFTDF